MSFESGQIGFRMCYALKELPTDAVQRFASKASPPLKSLGEEPSIGWVGGRHLFDLPISDENARLGGYLRLSLLKAERKVPSSLLRAESFMEELARMKADNKPFLDRKAKSEVRKQVMSRLLPQMPPTLRAIPFVHDERGGVVYVGAVSEQQMDAFRVNFLAATGIDLVPVNVETAVAQRRGQKAKQWAPASFSPKAADHEMENRPGQDFLTWLWFASEDRAGLFESRERGQIAVALEGPLLLERPGDGAHVIAIREGVPTASPEAQTALLTGKKLRRAKLTLACQDETWMTSFDADSFAFRVKLPDPRKSSTRRPDSRNASRSSVNFAICSSSCLTSSSTTAATRRTGRRHRRRFTSGRRQGTRRNRPELRVRRRDEKPITGPSRTLRSSRRRTRP